MSQAARPSRDGVLAELQRSGDRLRELGVEAIYLFGSVRRDEAGADSDIDVLIEVRRPFSYLDLAAVQRFLEETLGRRVDVGTVAMLRPDLRDDVLREAVRAA